MPIVVYRFTYLLAKTLTDGFVEPTWGCFISCSPCVQDTSSLPEEPSLPHWMLLGCQRPL